LPKILSSGFIALSHGRDIVCLDKALSGVGTMSDVFVGKNWVNLVVALGLAVIPLLVTMQKQDAPKAAQIQVDQVHLAQLSVD
jgi:hypothetical protein